MTQTPLSKRAGIAAAGAALLGCILPWVNTPLVNRSGLDTPDGQVLAVLAVVALVTGLMKASDRRLGLVYLVCGGLGTTVAVADLARLGRFAGPGLLAAVVSPGAGLYIDIGAFAVLAIAGLALLARKT